MKGTLTQGGATTDATQQGIDQAVAGGQFFWLDLDLHDPGPDDDVPGLLVNTFHFHPVAVEAADKFGQRARIDDYDDFVHVITFGMAGDGKNVAEVHCFLTVIFYLIMDTLIDSFFPVLSDFDDSIDNLYDHLIRISDLVDSYRDLISGAMDTHLSMVSNRLNVVMKQLAVIATVFLPLSFLTGFFGQNFAWPIAHIQENGYFFVILGIGSELVAIALLMLLFKRRGWLGSGPTA
jgi:Mg2+ and Co2+ transporter CorA